METNVEAAERILRELPNIDRTDTLNEFGLRVGVAISLAGVYATLALVDAVNGTADEVRKATVALHDVAAAIDALAPR